MSASDIRWFLLSLLIAGSISILGTWLFRSVAIGQGIVAHPNFRSLHQRATPRGGGIVFSLVTITSTAAAWAAGGVSLNLALAVVGGGSFATAIGLIDDARPVRPIWKFIAQGALAGWILLCFGEHPLLHIPTAPLIVDLAVTWTGLVWVMNIYNFLDGIDGLAATGAIFMCVAAILAMAVGAQVTRVGDLGPSLILGVVAVSTSGFLLFNWPPASVFMGDAGSLFLGVTFAALVANTVSQGSMTLWTWLIIFGYFGGDATTTTVLRLFITRKLYKEHRSHAYQNIARMRNSHRFVLIGVGLYHVLWLLPLAIWSVLVPASAALAVSLAILPVVLWTVRYGPLLSST